MSATTTMIKTKAAASLMAARRWQWQRAGGGKSAAEAGSAAAQRRRWQWQRGGGGGSLAEAQLRSRQQRFGKRGGSAVVAAAAQR
jgi:hypothetical protein